MFQAIETKFVGPTNSKGSRIVAKCQAGRIIVQYDYALNVDQNHERAADRLASRLGWIGDGYGHLIGGGSTKGDGYLFVFANTKRTQWEERSTQVYGAVR